MHAELSLGYAELSVLYVLSALSALVLLSLMSASLSQLFELIVTPAQERGVIDATCDHEGNFRIVLLSLLYLCF